MKKKINSFSAVLCLFIVYNLSFVILKAQSPWATYYGGTGFDMGTNVATDASGNVYLAGSTNSAVGIALSGFSNTYGGGVSDAFLVKFNSSGTRLWATYYGGVGTDYGYGVVTDASGNVYLSGNTASASNIASGGFQNSISWPWDAFLVKFNSAGIRQWATYYGYQGTEDGNSLATDASGNVYLAGSTSSLLNIASGGFQNVYGGGSDAYLVKFDPTGTRLWATYYGGTGSDAGNSVATDVSGNVYLAGSTTSLSNIASGGFQNTHGGVSTNPFLVKFNSSGNRLWATYYGGTGQDAGTAVATDGLGNVYLAGQVLSTTGIASGGFQNIHGGGSSDCFLAKFNSSGSRLWATYYGGSTFDVNSHIATDRNNNVYLMMEAEDQPTDPNLIDVCASQPVFNGNSPTDPFAFNAGQGPEDQIIVKFSPSGQKLCATYLGGVGEDDLENGGGITIYGNLLYITAYTDGGYPVTAGAFQTFYGGGTNTSDAFLTSLCTNFCEAKVLGLNYIASTTTVCPNAPIAFTPIINNACDTSGYRFQWIFTGGTSASSSIASPTVTFSGIGTHDVKLVLTTVCKKDSITKVITVNNCSISTPTVTAIGNSICFGSCAIVTSSVTGGTSPYSYLWSNGATTQNINPCPSATTAYTVTVIDFGGVLVTATTLVTVNPAITITVTITSPGCSAANGDATVIASGGTPSYEYSWSNGQTGATATSLSGGIYTVTVTDAIGCANATVVLVNTLPTLSVTISSSSVTCAGGSNGSASATVSGGNPNYSYAWSSSTQSTAVVTGLSAGNYNITVTDANGCISVLPFTISEPPALTASLTTTPETCLGNNGSATVYAGGGTPSYSYQWSNGQNTSQILNLTSQIYSVTVTDNNGCTKNATTLITVTPIPVVTISTVSPMCINAAGVTLSASPVGGTFSGTGVSGTTFNPSVSGAGTFTVTYTYTDGNGCTNSAITSVTVNALPVVTISNVSALCINAVGVTLSASPVGGTFSGTGVSGTIFDPSVSGAGTFALTYTYTDGNGCTNSAIASVTVNALPVVTINPVSAMCINASVVTLSASPVGGTFSGIGISGTTFDPSVSGAGTFTITYTYTNANGCTNSATTLVTVNPIPVVSINPIPILCINAAAEPLTGSPIGGTFSGTGVSGTNFNPSVSGMGTFTVTYTYSDAIGCANFTTITVTVNPIPIATAAKDTTIVLGTSTTLSASGGGTYNWIPTTGLSCSTCANPVASPMETTYYCVTVSNGSGCTDSACVTITVNTHCDPFIPSAFSPNEDSENETACVYGASCMSIVFKIYNRWGQVVFETENPSGCWNGMYKGKPMNTALFYYTFEGTYINAETIFKKGTISLIR